MVYHQTRDHFRLLAQNSTAMPFSALHAELGLLFLQRFSFTKLACVNPSDSKNYTPRTDTLGHRTMPQHRTES